MFVMKNPTVSGKACRLFWPTGIACLTVAILAFIALGHTRAEDATKRNPWEGEIQKFEAHDREAAPPEHPILFVGSSSIRLWDLDKSFPDLPVLNRGFGGSMTADVVHFADRIVFPYRPRMIVFYSGDNDIAGGKKPETVAADFAALLKQIRDRLPDTPVIYLPTKPSILRWNLYPRMKEANDLVRAMAKEDPLLIVAGTDQVLLRPDGKPRPELFRFDGLHLNDEGYKLWSDIVGPLIEPKTAAP